MLHVVEIYAPYSNYCLSFILDIYIYVRLFCYTFTFLQLYLIYDRGAVC